MEQKKVVYISGPIKGVEKYWEAFEQAEDDLTALGYIPLSPARLPGGMTLAQYMRINFAMIDSADAVLFLADWDRSEGACLEYQYCEYIGKPRVPQRTREWDGREHPREVTLAWLKHDLVEVLGA
jgi:nucleoside 2-deoxyribosyltransferase